MASMHEEMMRRNIAVMNSLEGFDVVIICCSSGLQASYWQERLEAGRGSVLPPSSVVLAVEEDWPGGAGNALGTLYAFENAAKLASSKFGLDIKADLLSGKISVGLYHTAGKGTRLAPLPGAENNNKPGVKLPASVTLQNGTSARITILESVIKQTGCYSKSRPGRLSVFWGDQVFIPTVPVEYQSTYHVDILCSLGPMMTAEEWTAKGMEKYGLVAQAARGAAQVEKVSHATAVELLAGLGEIISVGVSLGSFSVSALMLDTLLAEFSGELQAKKGKLDSDPHLWMPMTLSQAAYGQLMKQKGVSEEVSDAHYARIQSMLATFNAREGSNTMALFGAVDVGQGLAWWDYGQLKLYQKFALMPSESGSEADLMRLFFGYSDTSIVNSTLNNTTVADQSCVCDSTIGSAAAASNIAHSVVCGVRTHELQANGAILINVTARRIVAAEGAVVYNVVDTSEAGLVLEKGQVMAGVFNDKGEQEILNSSLAIDGGKAWETVVAGNSHSFEQIYDLNATVSPIVLENVITAAHVNAFAQF